MKKIKFKNWNCVIKRSTYVDNDNLALILLEENTGEVISTVTINGSVSFPEDVGIVKDYSENNGMLESLTSHGLVKEKMGYYKTGFVMSPVILFDLTDVEEMHD